MPYQVQGFTQGIVHLILKSPMTVLPKWKPLHTKVKQTSLNKLKLNLIVCKSQISFIMPVMKLIFLNLFKY